MGTQIQNVPMHTTQKAKWRLGARWHQDCQLRMLKAGSKMEWWCWKVTGWDRLKSCAADSGIKKEFALAVKGLASCGTIFTPATSYPHAKRTDLKSRRAIFI